MTDTLNGWTRREWLQLTAAGTVQAAALMGTRADAAAPTSLGVQLYTVRSLDYRGGALDLVLIADSVATLDSVRERVLSMGMKASLSAVSAGELGTEAKLHVEAAP